MLDKAWSGTASKRAWWFLFLTLVPLSFYLRFQGLNSPLMDVHPIRQTQTALTTYYFAHGDIGFWDYRSPLNGKLWDFVFELPVYQWITAQFMKLGLGLEMASRLVNIGFFIGCAALFSALLAEILGFSYAVWGGLLFFTAPFNIVFSRTALIDWTALFFALLMAFSFARALKTQSVLWLLLMTLGGSLAGAIKVTAWYLPVAILGLTLLWAFATKRCHKVFFLFALGSFAMQLAATLAWTHWADSIRANPNSNAPWLLGPLSIRTELWRYKKIFGGYLGRWVLAEWLVVPFVLGLLMPRDKKVWAWVSFLALCTGILVFFNVHTYHDYYLIVLLPFVFLIVSIGMVRVFEFKGPVQILMTLVLAVLFVHQVTRASALFGSLFYDYEKEISLARELKAMTDPEDVIIMTDEVLQAWHIPLYAERLATPILPKQITDLNPSVVRFYPGKEDWTYMKDVPSLWIEADAKALWFFRVREMGSHKFNAETHIALMDKGSLGLPTLQWGTQTIKTCGASPAKVFNVPSSAKGIAIHTPTQSFSLPVRRFLSLPRQSIWGCEYQVEVTS